MDKITADLLRAATCGAVAALVTLMSSLAFAQLTSLPPRTEARADGSVGMPRQQAWFGQPEPAGLVD